MEALRVPLFRAEAMARPRLQPLQGQTRTATLPLPKKNNDCAFCKHSCSRHRGCRPAEVIRLRKCYGGKAAPGYNSNAHMKARFAQIDKQNSRTRTYFAGNSSAYCGASRAIGFDFTGSAAPFIVIASS